MRDPVFLFPIKVEIEQKRRGGAKMIILKENKRPKQESSILNEGVSIEQIQKKILMLINKEAETYSAMKAQASSPQKVYLGVCLAHLRAIAKGLSPIQLGNYPSLGKNPKLDDDIRDVYRKLLIPTIQQMDKIYEQSYGDELY
jgi:hypothetical protein